MRFARTHLVDEFRVVHPAIIYLTCALDSYLKTTRDCECLVTHIFRTDRQQLELYPSEPKRHSLHQDWRALDFVGWRSRYTVVFDDSTLTALTDFAHKLIPNSRLPLLITETHGTGPHVHVQVGLDIEWAWEV